jgi:hypothetical protein
MSDIEDLLRAAMKDHTERLSNAPGIAQRAIRRADRVRRAQYAATATVAALGTTAAVGVVTHNAGSQTTASGPGACLSSSAASAAPASSGASVSGSATVTSSASVASPAAATASAAIAAVRLPNPAPGFPVRRLPDAVGTTEFATSTTQYWTATFLLGVTPGVTSSPGPVASGSNAPTVTEVDPTGPQATVQVIDGHPDDLSAPTSIEGMPVIGTRQLQGHRAYVTASCDTTDLYLTTGQFEVAETGFGGTTLDQLIALEGALTGLQ